MRDRREMQQFGKNMSQGISLFLITSRAFWSLSCLQMQGAEMTPTPPQPQVTDGILAIRPVVVAGGSRVWILAKETIQMEAKWVCISALVEILFVLQGSLLCELFSKLLPTPPTTIRIYSSVLAVCDKSNNRAWSVFRP